MKGTFLSNKTSLTAADSDTCDILAAIPELTTLVVDIKQNRNPGFHRLAFSRMHLLWEMADIDVAFEPWRRWLLIQTGYCTTTGFPDGSVLVEADSMNWESMSQDKFKQAWLDLHQKWVDIYGEKLTQDQLQEWAML